MWTAPTNSVFFVPLDAPYARLVAVGVCGLVATVSGTVTLLPSALAASVVVTLLAMLVMVQRDRWSLVRRHRWAWVRRLYQNVCIYHLAWRLDRACAALAVENDETDLFPGGAGV